VTVSPFFAGCGLSAGGRVFAAKKGDSHRVTFFALLDGLLPVVALFERVSAPWAREVAHSATRHGAAVRHGAPQT
jgi:hypothetical protein